MANFLEAEIKLAVDSCEGSKSPSPDGFNMGFIRDFWELFKDDLMRMFEEFHQHDIIVKWLNLSFIVLIPKKEETSRPSDYRPISLIGVVYKIIAKFLSIRLNMVLGSIIYEEQSAFISGRQIMDIMVVLNEVIEEVRAKRNDDKINFAKAYDSVDWGFLKLIMSRLKFR